MKTKVLAIALATVAGTIAADAAFARSLVRVSDSGQVSIPRNRKAQRIQLPDAVIVGGVVGATSSGWAIPYVGGYSGHNDSTDW